MRKPYLLALFFCVSVAAFAQVSAAPSETTQFTAETDHYRVISETSQSQAEDVARHMEGALALYNSVFHFDLSLLTAKFQVRVLKDVDSFNAYLQKILSQTRTDFVFVAWSDPSRSELLAFPKPTAAFNASLLHQGCIQFLKGFVDNPPVWLREGVATYLDAAVWDPKSSTFTPKANLAWLDTLRSMVRGETPNKLIDFADLLQLSRERAQSQQQVFAPESWGLVQFLLNAPDRAYSRIFWDSLNAMDPKATLEANSLRVRKRAFSWVADQALQQDFSGYILALQTPNDLVRQGIDSYTNGDLASAEATFTKAIDLEQGNITSWYYLGLIAYARKDYAKAEDDYLKAFQLGANAGVINYALGVNSFAAGKNADAQKYLTFAKQSDQAAYGDKVDVLLKRIQGTK